MRKVVYTRKKHVFRVKDITNIAISLINNRRQDELYSQSIAIQTLFKVIRDGLWPYWLDASGAPRLDHISPQDENAIESFIRDVWKTKTQHIADEWAEELGVPARIREWVLDWLYEYIWDAIWALTDPWFAYQKQRRRK